MKKIIMKIVILILLCLPITAWASCPPGYEEHTINVIYNYQNYFTCHVTLVFFCKWDNDLKAVLVEFDRLWGTYDNCIDNLPDWPDFITWLDGIALDSANKFCTPQYPPCDDPHNNFYYYEYSRAQCLYVENEFIPPAPGEEPLWKHVI